MPRGQRPPSYLHHKPSGQARCRIDGRDIYLGSYGSAESRMAYRNLLDAWERRQHGQHGQQFVSSPLLTPRAAGTFTVARLILAHDEYARKRYSSNQQRRFRKALQHVLSLFPNTPAATFDLACLEAVRGRMVRLGFARTYINALIVCIKKTWKWAASQKLVPVETYQHLALLDGLPAHAPGVKETDPVKPVTLEHVEKTLPWLRPPVAAMVRLQLLTGMRPGEVRLMRPMDLDCTGTIWIYRPAKHKNRHRGQQRVIHLGPRAQEILAPFLRNRPKDAYLFSPKDSLRGCRGDGRPDLRDCYDGMTYPRAVSRAAMKAGVPVWHPNQLRHTAATMIRAQYGPDAARVILGQKSLQATAIYAELDYEKASRIMENVG